MDLATEMSLQNRFLTRGEAWAWLEKNTSLVKKICKRASRILPRRMGKTSPIIRDALSWTRGGEDTVLVEWIEPEFYPKPTYFVVSEPNPHDYDSMSRAYVLPSFNSEREANLAHKEGRDVQTLFEVATVKPKRVTAYVPNEWDRLKRDRKEIKVSRLVSKRDKVVK